MSEPARPVVSGLTYRLGLQRLRQGDCHELKAAQVSIAIMRAIHPNSLSKAKQAESKQRVKRNVYEKVLGRWRGPSPLSTGGATSTSEWAPEQLRGDRRQPFSVEDVKINKKIPGAQASL